MLEIISKFSVRNTTHHTTPHQPFLTVTTARPSEGGQVAVTGAQLVLHGGGEVGDGVLISTFPLVGAGLAVAR